jgi:hypothetical protein
MTKSEIIAIINTEIANQNIKRWHIRKAVKIGGKDLDNILGGLTDCHVSKLIKIAECLNLKIEIK